jgi:phosphoserine aminotransferase
MNFYAGPTASPWPVLERTQRELADFQGTGMSAMEVSHRAPDIQLLLADTIERARADYVDTGYWAQKSIREPR